MIRDGVDHDTAVRVLVHLGSNCYSCRKPLEELIGLATSTATSLARLPLLLGWPEKVWARRFAAIRVSDEPEAQWSRLTDEEYRGKIAELLREIETEAAERRGDSPVRGMSNIRRQDPCHRPPRTKRSPRPRFHAVDRDHFLGLVAEYREFLVNYRAASEALKSCDLGSRLPRDVFAV